LTTSAAIAVGMIKVLATPRVVSTVVAFLLLLVSATTSEVVVLAMMIRWATELITSGARASSEILTRREGLLLLVEVLIEDFISSELLHRLSLVTFVIA